MTTSPSKVPVAKVAAAGIGGAVATVILWLLNVFAVDVPPAVAGAIATICAFAAGYIKAPAGIGADGPPGG